MNVIKTNYWQANVKKNKYVCKNAYYGRADHRDK